MVPKEGRTCGQVMISEEASGNGEKSETPILAVNPGNAGGVEGSRFEKTRQGSTDLHREETTRDHTI